MEELGKVISVKGNKAKVLINRHAACGECGACQIGKERMTMETLADNKIKAKPGDNVMVYMKFINVIVATSIAYGIPFLFFIFGILAGWFLAPSFNLDQVWDDPLNCFIWNYLFSRKTGLASIKISTDYYQTG